MKVPPNKLQITEIFDIYLPDELWQKIVSYSKQHQISYSWVSRICVFRSIKKHSKKLVEFQKTSKRLKILQKRTVKTGHRHKLCLYGDDCLELRIAASKAGFTISQFVRISLWLYLKIFEKNLDKKLLVFFGTKLISSINKHFFVYDTENFMSNQYWPYRPISRYVI